MCTNASLSTRPHGFLTLRRYDPTWFFAPVFIKHSNFLALRRGVKPIFDSRHAATTLRFFRKFIPNIQTFFIVASSREQHVLLKNIYWETA